MIININNKANNPYLIDDYTKLYLRWYLIIIFSTFRCLLIASSPCSLLPGKKGVRKFKYAVLKSLPPGGWI
jgi:hypothetical protein